MIKIMCDPAQRTLEKKEIRVSKRAESLMSGEPSSSMLHYTTPHGTLYTQYTVHTLHKMPILFATTLYTMAPTISASPPRRASGGILSRAWRIRANLRISCPR